MNRPVLTPASVDHPRVRAYRLAYDAWCDARRLLDKATDLHEASIAPTGEYQNGKPIMGYRKPWPAKESAAHNKAWEERQRVEQELLRAIRHDLGVRSYTYPTKRRTES